MTSPIIEPDAPAPDNALERVAKLLVMLGCGVLIALSMLIVINIAMLALFRISLLGISEITELAMGIAVFAFFPYTQLRSAHIIVDLLDWLIPIRLRDGLDAVHNLVFTVVIGIVTWRLAVGCIDAWVHNEMSMMLSLPHWIGYAAASVSSFVFAVACAYTSVRNFWDAVR
jgi:TRAP-type C4-dicarboxylate transport system permease small subunit